MSDRISTLEKLYQKYTEFLGGKISDKEDLLKEGNAFILECIKENKPETLIIFFNTGFKTEEVINILKETLRYHEKEEYWKKIHTEGNKENENLVHHFAVVTKSKELLKKLIELFPFDSRENNYALTLCLKTEFYKGGYTILQSLIEQSRKQLTLCERRDEINRRNILTLTANTIETTAGVDSQYIQRMSNKLEENISQEERNEIKTYFSAINEVKEFLEEIHNS